MIIMAQSIIFFIVVLFFCCLINKATAKLTIKNQMSKPVTSDF